MITVEKLGSCGIAEGRCTWYDEQQLTVPRVSRLGTSPSKRSRRKESTSKYGYS